MTSHKLPLPCEEPLGGWPERAFRREPDFARTFASLTSLEQVLGATVRGEPGTYVLLVAMSGEGALPSDLIGTLAGSLCVRQLEWRQSDLQEVMAELVRRRVELGWWSLGVGFRADGTFGVNVWTHSSAGARSIERVAKDGMLRVFVESPSEAVMGVAGSDPS